MRTKWLLHVLLLVLCGFTARAQDKYDFMVICYRTNVPWITVSSSGKEVISEGVEIKKKADEDPDNASPLLKKVHEFQEQNWEVMSFDVIPATMGHPQCYYAFLRKKTSP